MSLAEAEAARDLNLENSTLRFETSSLLVASISKLKSIQAFRDAIVYEFFSDDHKAIIFEMRQAVYEVSYTKSGESQFLSVTKIEKPTEERISILISPEVSGFLHIEETKESGQIKVVKNSSNSNLARERIINFLDQI